ncbi:hypothetical protein BH20ACI2_BH20ACI2_20250 [soil metagenome]
MQLSNTFDVTMPDLGGSISVRAAARAAKRGVVRHRNTGGDPLVANFV